MYSKLSAYIAIVMLAATASVCAQKPRMSRMKLQLGGAGQIVLNIESELSGTFSLIDRGGITTHTGTWKKNRDNLTWKTMTGGPALDGSTIRIEGAWRVYWKVRGEAAPGTKPVGFEVGATGTATVSIPKAKPLVAAVPKKVSIDRGLIKPSQKKSLAKRRVGSRIIYGESKKLTSKVASKKPAKKVTSKLSPIAFRR